MPAKPLEILRQFWGYDAFRPKQEEIIDAVLEGRDVLALLPTGGGKSICFQVPGMALPGLTIVISPLIALMRDQVDNLNRRHIPATFINSSLSYRDIDRKLQRAMDGEYKFLYLAPERLRTEMFRMRLPKMDVSLIAVDEAHCISQWGYDFRPAYLDIALIRETLPKVPMIALTATAPPKVSEDIVGKLEMNAPAVFKKSFRRENLAYRVIETDRVPDRILQFLRNTPGAGIIYARTRKRVKALADLLLRHDIPAAAYHGGLPTRERNKVQADWIANKTRVIAATNAFGMGIDKPDVRFVIHFNLPADPESYYQEAGRGGRDGESAIALAFRNEQDLHELQRWVKEKYPNWEQVNRHYEVLCNCFGITTGSAPEKLFHFDIRQIASKFKVNPLRLYNSTKLLDNAGILSLQERPEDYGHLRVSVRPRDILEYKDRFPDKARLIDHILRSLGGEAYQEMMRFSADYWARQLEMEPAALETELQQLAARKIINYRPPTGNPTIRFFKPRHKLSKQGIGWERYEFLESRAKERLEAIIDYAEVPAGMCRSRILEQYFGENRKEDCGVCDHCRSKAAGKLSPAQRRSVGEQMLGLCSEKELEVADLLAAVDPGTNAEKLEILRELMDKKLLRRVKATRVVRW